MRRRQSSTEQEKERGTVPVSMKDLKRAWGHDMPALRDAAILIGTSSAANIAERKTDSGRKEKG